MHYINNEQGAANMSLITHQMLCIDRMLEPRTSEKRALKNRMAALRIYRTNAALAGFSAPEIEQQVRDIKDMYQLELNAED